MTQMPKKGNIPLHSYIEDLYEQHHIKVDPKQSPIRLDKFLMDRLERVSRNRVQNAIKAGSIQVNNKEVKPNYKVRPLDDISVLLPKPSRETYKVIPQDISLDIIYEDDDLLIVNKPANMCAHPGIGHSKDTLVNALAYHFNETPLPVMSGNEADRPGLVHRIDKDTTGLMVIAKNAFAMSHLAKQFFHHSIQRKYHALVWGEFEDDEGTVVAHVGRDIRHRKRMTAFPEGDRGKWAVTHYKVLERLYYVSLVECQLETGRTHQIRVHMKHKGHPLFSDEKYGGTSILKGTVFSKYRNFVEDCFEAMPRHALHAKSLGFTHPATGEEMYFEIDLPHDFKQLLQMWRDYLEKRKKLVKGRGKY